MGPKIGPYLLHSRSRTKILIDLHELCGHVINYTLPLTIPDCVNQNGDRYSSGFPINAIVKCFATDYDLQTSGRPTQSLWLTWTRPTSPLYNESRARKRAGLLYFGAYSVTDAMERVLHCSSPGVWYASLRKFKLLTRFRVDWRQLHRCFVMHVSWIQLW